MAITGTETGGETLKSTLTDDDPFDDSDSQRNPVPETITAILRAPIGSTSPWVNTQPQFNVPTAEELTGAHFDTRTDCHCPDLDHSDLCIPDAPEALTEGEDKFDGW